MNLETTQLQIYNKIKYLIENITKYQTIEDVIINEKNFQILYENVIIVKKINEIIKYNKEVFKKEDVIHINTSEVEEIKTTQTKKLLQHNTTQHTKRIFIDFNDRIGFINYLFNGNANELDVIIDKLNAIETQNESQQTLNELIKQHNWAVEKEEFIERLKILNDKRFE